MNHTQACSATLKQHVYRKVASAMNVYDLLEFRNTSGTVHVYHLRMLQLYMARNYV